VFPDGPETVAVNVTDWPLSEGFSDEVSDVVEVALAAEFTTCVSTGEVEPVKFVSPPYDAVIECEPVASADVLSIAWPDALRVPVPSEFAPSRKVTVPVGTVAFPVGPETVAVNITDCPLVDGFSDDVNEVVEAAALLWVAVPWR
jgi:hypothetical protein